MKESSVLKDIDGALKCKILRDFEQRIQRDKSFGAGLLLVHSPSLGIHWKTSAHHDPTVVVNPDQPYHFASIGKTITAVMITILYEKGLIDFEDNVYKFLDHSVLSGLHVLGGVDYSHELRIRHLLNHTSGLPDYYTDKNRTNVRLCDCMVSDPDHFWTPLETIDWSKRQLTPRFKPGKGFHYSDTNYQLLGLIIEEVAGMKLHEAFHQYIFDPLGMDNTYMIFYSQPKVTCEWGMTDLYYKGVNLSNAKSISMSWASGGVVSTSEDMLKFHKAIVENKVINKESFERMSDYARMGPSIYYGYGIMNFRFMCMPKKYYIWGNSGSIGAFMYYNPEMDIYMIGSFHKLNYQVQPIFYLFNTLRRFNKELKR